MIIKRFFHFLCLQFLASSVFTLCGATDNTIVVKYGQDLDSIVSYNKQGEVTSKIRYFFDEDQLSSATIEIDKGVYNYQYTYTQDSYIEEITFSEKTSSAGDLTYISRKVIENNPGKNAEYNYSWNNNSWEKENGSVSTFVNQLLSQVEDVTGVNDNWVAIQRITYSYYTSSENALFAGKLKEMRSFADAQKESSKIEYSYTQAGADICLQSEIVYATNEAGNFQKCMSTEYSYPSNNQENVISTVSYFEPETQKLVGKEKHTLARQPEKLNTYQFQTFDALNNMIESRNNTYSYQNNNQIVEENNSITNLSNNNTKTQRTRFSTNLSENKPENVVQEYFSGNNWVKKEELTTSYNAEGKPLQKELKKYTELTNTPVPLYKTDWKYKPGAGVDTYTTYTYDESASQTSKSWSFVVYYQGDGSIDPDGLDHVESNKKSSISIYPNPASEYIFISEGGQTFDSPIQYSIYNLTGKLQTKGAVYTPQEGIAVSMLTSGSYVLHLTKDGKHASCVFVKR